jgi:hypothetical protein
VEISTQPRLRILLSKNDAALVASAGAHARAKAGQKKAATHAAAFSSGCELWELPRLATAARVTRSDRRRNGLGAVCGIDGTACCDTLPESEEKGGGLKYTLSVVLTLCTILLAAGTAKAHHSPSSIFDMSQKFTLTGTLTQVDWVNPHIAVYIDAKKADGSGVENWKFESAPPSWLKRVGVNSTDFKKAIGQSVTVEGNRARDGSPYGFLQKITFADGNSLAMVSPNDVNTTH